MLGSVCVSSNVQKCKNLCVYKFTYSFFWFVQIIQNVFVYFGEN